MWSLTLGLPLLQNTAQSTSILILSICRVFPDTAIVLDYQIQEPGNFRGNISTETRVAVPSWLVGRHGFLEVTKLKSAVYG